MLVLSCGKKDDQLPVVLLNGEDIIIVPLNSSFTDPGATANDNVDGLLSVSISGNVNTQLEGDYEIIYNATDAVGNTGEAVRLVRVFNDARTLSGTYSTISYTFADTSSFQSFLTTSTTINNRIWLQGFAQFDFAVVYADLIGDSIKIPEQQSLAQGSIHFFSAAGIVNTGDTLIIAISFSDSLSGNIYTGTSIYKKPF